MELKGYRLVPLYPHPPPARHNARAEDTRNTAALARAWHTYTPLLSGPAPLGRPYQVAMAGSQLPPVVLE